MITKTNIVGDGKKARVYFIACGDKEEELFNKTTEMIFKHQKCVIYYDEPGETPNYDDLGFMNLIVIGITGKFLYEKDHVSHSVLKFAEDNHIPILPIVFDYFTGYEISLLNPLIDNRQYLDYVSNDNTMISFDDKLAAFLKRIFLGEEVIEKIRASFEAYIFLSYRKKDRAYANRLMKLIHKNEFARDVAIWFDEFLVPGEDFNASIKAALEKSDLFVLNVTPSLIDAPDADKNYIRQCEYPMAVDYQKKILPVEMSATDKISLEEQYNGIPLCINPYDEEEFARELYENLKDIVNDVRNDDPTHTFFIGLAYLEGIDVERNPKIAFDLINSAAESGLTDAMEKLADMYEHGVGIRHDMTSAMSWKGKYAKALENEYDGMEEPTEEAAMRMLEAKCEYIVSRFNAGQDFNETLRKSEALEHKVEKIIERFYPLFWNLYLEYSNKQNGMSELVKNMDTASIQAYPRPLNYILKCWEWESDCYKRLSSSVIDAVKSKYLDTAKSKYRQIVDFYLGVIKNVFHQSGQIGDEQFEQIFLNHQMEPNELSDVVDISACSEYLKRVALIYSKCDTTDETEDSRISNRLIAYNIAVLLDDRFGEYEYKEMKVKFAIAIGDEEKKIHNYSAAVKWYLLARDTVIKLSTNYDIISKFCLFDALIRVAEITGQLQAISKDFNVAKEFCKLVNAEEYFKFAMLTADYLVECYGYSITSKTNYLLSRALYCDYLIENKLYEDVSQLYGKIENMFMKAETVNGRDFHYIQDASSLPESEKISEAICLIYSVYIRVAQLAIECKDYSLAANAYFMAYERIEYIKGFNFMGIFLKLSAHYIQLADIIRCNVERSRDGDMLHCYKEALWLLRRAEQLDLRDKRVLLNISVCNFNISGLCFDYETGFPDYKESLSYCEEALKYANILLELEPDNEEYLSVKKQCGELLDEITKELAEDNS